MTGAPMPPGCDAVLPAESVEVSGEPTSIAAIAAVSPGKNIGRRGEDIARRIHRRSTPDARCVRRISA